MSDVIDVDSLTTQRTLIDGVDMLGGTSEQIHLSIIVEIYNPSNMNLQAGDAYFEPFSNSSAVGTVLRLLRVLAVSAGMSTVRSTGLSR